MILLCWALIAFAIAPNARASAGGLGLNEAVRFALENSPVFDTAKKTQALRDLEYKTSIAKILPSLDLAATHGLQNNLAIGGNDTLLTANPSAPWYSSLSLGVTETLYDNGVSLTNAKIADLNRDIASVNYFKARDALTLNVSLEFYRFSLATVLLEVRKQQQQILDKQFRTLSSQYQQGFKTKSDFLRLKAQVQRAEIDRITAENNVELSVAELRKLLGVKLQEPNQPAFTAVPVNRDQNIESLIPTRAPSFENIYDYRITKIQEEINGKSVTLAKRNNLPRISVTSGVTYSNLNYLHSNIPFGMTDQLSWNALLTVQYNFWDWGIRRRDVQIAEFNLDIQENVLNQNLLDINTQIRRLMLDLARLTRNYKLTRDLLGLEEESNRNLESQFREGKVSYLDLITSINSLLDAKVQFYTSYYEALQGAARYNYFEGKIYETISHP